MKDNTRRNFLKNTALATLSVGILPELVNAKDLQKANSTAACNPTTLDYYGQGPFYTANAPVITDNQLAGQDEPGTRLVLSGVVKTLDCSSLIPNAMIEIWHANDAGQYDNTGYNLRGTTFSNAQGFYLFETILPGKYLNGTSYRPRHLHFKITAPGFPPLITQVYFEGDTDIPSDAAASISSGTYDATHRIIPLVMNGQKYEGSWDIIINGSPSGINDLHLDKGLIYAVTPNPVNDTAEVSFGIYEAAKISIRVFDLKGFLVAVLEENFLKSGKYKIPWDSSKTPSGVYFITLKINELQVHYQKVVK